MGARWGQSPGKLEATFDDGASNTTILRGNLPFQRNLMFAGRDATLQTISHKLSANDLGVRRVAVCGMGGVGKTQVAIEFAYRNSSDYRLIWWLRAEDPTPLSDDFLSIGDYLRLEEMAGLNRPAVIRAIRENLEQGERWLLIFDNAERPEDLIPFLPRVAKGDVVITSRNHLWGDLAIPVSLKAWERTGSVEFLDKALSRPSGMDGDNLAADLGDLPLAIAQAAAYINRTAIGIDDYRKLFRERREELWGREARPLGYTDTVSTTWNLALRHIKESQPTSAALLVLFAQVGSGSLTIYRSLSQTFRPPFRDVLSDPLKFAEAIAPLRQYSLVEVNGDLIVIHPLVRSVVLDYQGSELLEVTVEQAAAPAPVTPPPPAPGSSPSEEKTVQSLTLRAARELLLATPQPEINEIRELFGALYLPECGGNSTDYETVLQFMKRRFATAILLDAEKVSDVIRAATTAAATFKPEPDADDWKAGYGRVRALIEPVVTVLPREGECLTRLASFPPETVAAFTIVDRQMRRDYPTEPRFYLKVIDFCSIGRLAWVVLEQYVREATHVKNWTLAEVVKIGRRDLGEEFEARYLRLRPKLYETELADSEAEDKRREAERDEQYRKERAEKQVRLERELAQYEVAAGTPKPIPSRRALEIIKQHLASYVARVRKIAERDPKARSQFDDDPWADLKAASDGAKFASRKYYPEVCRDIVLMMHDPPGHAVYAARQLVEILERAHDEVEIDLAGLEPERKLSDAQVEQSMPDFAAQFRSFSVKTTLQFWCIVLVLALNCALTCLLIWRLTK